MCESWQPQAMSPAALERVAGASPRAVTEALGGLGVFGVELFVRGDDVWFSEVSPRPHDTGLVTLVSQPLSEFALHARAILGLPVDVSLREPGARARSSMAGWTPRASPSTASTRRCACPPPSSACSASRRSFERRRMGVALARGATVDEARERAREAASRVKPVAT